jgi:hypothetical protein
MLIVVIFNITAMEIKKSISKNTKKGAKRLPNFEHP